MLFILFALITSGLGGLLLAGYFHPNYAMLYGMNHFYVLAGFYALGIFVVISVITARGREELDK